jgi:hypothetical protein
VGEFLGGFGRVVGDRGWGYMRFINMERESSREKLERKSKRGLLQQTAPLRLIKDSTDKTAP